MAKAVATSLTVKIVPVVFVLRTAKLLTSVYDRSSVASEVTNW